MLAFIIYLYTLILTDIRSVFIFIAFALGSLGYGQPYFSANLLEHPADSVEFWESAWDVEELPVFIKDPSVRSVLLSNGYSSVLIANPKAWPPKIKNLKVVEINMILTLYPKNKKFWRTNYYQLMADRLKALFQLDPRLNDQGISYNLILQTGCSSEAEAKSMFHGFEIVVEEQKILPPKKELSVFDTMYENNRDSLYWVSANSKLQRQIKRTGGITDSIVFKGLSNWPLDSALITIDCTGSMDPYAYQVLLWMARNFNDRNRFFSLFNDARGNPDRVMIGMFDHIDGLMKMLRKSRSIRGENREREENNLEAVVEGLRKFPFLKSVVMIADNGSCVKDYELLNCIKVPVNIILCGDKYGVNPQYLDIALHTGGTVCLSDNQVLNPGLFATGKKFQIGANTYYYNKKKKRFMEGKDNVSLHQACGRFYKTFDCQ